jgi:hypothetical protein
MAQRVGHADGPVQLVVIEDRGVIERVDLQLEVAGGVVVVLPALAQPAYPRGR